MAGPTTQPKDVKYLAAIRDRWLLIVVVVAVAVVGAAVYAGTAPKRYQATASLLVTPIDPSDAAFIGIPVLRDSPGDPNRSVVTASRFVKTPETINVAAKRLGGDFSHSVSVTPIGQANIVSITANAPTAARAAQIANAFAESTIYARTVELHQQLAAATAQLSAQLRRLRAHGGAGTGEVGALGQRLGELALLAGQPDPALHVVSRAQPPTSASWPRPTLSIAIAALASLLLGIGLAVGLEVASPRIKHEEELLFVQRLPILARVPRVSSADAQRYLADTRPMPGAIWEAFRSLRANLSFTAEDGREMPQIIVFTSSMPNEGKTFAATMFALSLAASGLRVVLVDGDLRRPTIGSIFGVNNRQDGLAQMFKGTKTTRDPQLLSAPHYPGLKLLLATPQSVNRIDLLEFRRVESVLAKLREEADVVVIDSSPLVDVADALILAESADAVLVAVRVGHTLRDRLNELRRILDRHDVPIAGLVLTTRERPRKDPYYGAPQYVRQNFPALPKRNVPPRAGAAVARRVRRR